MLESTFFGEAEYLNPEDLAVKNKLNSFIICTICQGILINPKECSNCQRSYCTGCIDKWLKIKQKCPNNCKFFTFIKGHVVLRNVLETLEFNCALPDCPKVLTYNEKLNRIHESQCHEDNSRGCLFSREANSLIEKSKMACLFCGKELEIDNLKEHELKCRVELQVEGNFNAKCTICFTLLIVKGVNVTDSGSLKCEHCKKYFCSKCISNCSVCKKILCRETKITCNCLAKAFCSDCEAALESKLEKCTECEEEMNLKCSNCREVVLCKTCDNFFCTSCRDVCFFCKKTMCNSCLQQCEMCENKFCKCSQKVLGFQVELESLRIVGNKYACFGFWSSSGWVTRILVIIFYIFILLFVFIYVVKTAFCCCIFCDCKQIFCQTCKESLLE